MIEYCKELATEFNKDIRVINAIVGSPIAFMKQKIEDPTDFRPIRIRYFGQFIPKKGKYSKQQVVENQNGK